MERKTIKIPRKKFLLAIIILIIIGFWRLSGQTRRYILPAYNVGVEKTTLGGAPRPDIAYPDYRRENLDITDARQFLKTSYSANIQTRDVIETVRDVKTAVYEAEGRIDNLQESDRYGTVSFVVPKSRFENFRNEIERLTYRKLITVNIFSENLLGEKQSLEEQLASATATLASLEKQKSDLAYGHTQAINTLTAELLAVQAELNIVRQNIAITSDPSQLNSLRNQEASLVQRETTLKQSRDNENRSYASQNQNLVYQIDQAKNIIAGIEKADTKFTSNIETVNGDISIQWVNWWQLAKILSPVHPGWIILALAIIVWKILGRFGYAPRIELV